MKRCQSPQPSLPPSRAFGPSAMTGGAAKQLNECLSHNLHICAGWPATILEHPTVNFPRRVMVDRTTTARPGETSVPRGHPYKQSNPSSTWTPLLPADSTQVKQAISSVWHIHSNEGVPQTIFRIFQAQQSCRGTPMAMQCECLESCCS